MYSIEEYDVFGDWRPNSKQFDDFDDAYEYCLCLAETIGIYCRILDQHGHVVDLVDAVSPEQALWEWDDADDY